MPLGRVFEFSEAFNESQNGHNEQVKALFKRISTIR
jgi:hypothetical protein